MTQDRRDLKVLALKQRLAEIVVEYEDKDAERRIEITELTERLNEVEKRYSELLEAPHETTEEAVDPTDLSD